MLKSLLKKVIPPSIVDRVHSYRNDPVILASPDRTFVADALFPAVAASGVKRLLYVGVRSYTRNYPELLARRGVEAWTTDIDPVAARYGAPERHLTADVTKLTPQSFPVAFDMVVFSGVIGFGVDGEDQIDASARAIAGLLPAGGRCVLGWNSDKAADPMERGDWGRLFARAALPGLDARVAFEGSTHIFDALARR